MSPTSCQTAPPRARSTKTAILTSFRFGVKHFETLFNAASPLPGATVPGDWHMTLGVEKLAEFLKSGLASPPRTDPEVARFGLVFCPPLERLEGSRLPGSAPPFGGSRVVHLRERDSIRLST